MSTYCDLVLPAHEQSDCGSEKKGGIRAFAILELNHTINDYTSASQWAAAIAAGKAHIVKDIKGELPDPSPVEGDSLSACGPETQLDNFDRTFQAMSKHAYGNVDLINTLNKKVTYVAMYTCDGQLRVVDSADVRWVAFTSTPNTNKQKVTVKYTAKWTQFDEPEWYDGSALASIFE